jgi:hypothetical protein
MGKELAGGDCGQLPRVTTEFGAMAAALWPGNLFPQEAERIIADARPLYRAGRRTLAAVDAAARVLCEGFDHYSASSKRVVRRDALRVLRFADAASNYGSGRLVDDESHADAGIRAGHEYHLDAPEA